MPQAHRGMPAGAPEIVGAVRRSTGIAESSRTIDPSIDTPTPRNRLRRSPAAWQRLECGLSRGQNLSKRSIRAVTTRCAARRARGTRAMRCSACRRCAALLRMTRARRHLQKNRRRPAQARSADPSEAALRKRLGAAERRANAHLPEDTRASRCPVRGWTRLGFDAHSERPKRM